MKNTRKKRNGTKRHMLLLPVFLVAVVALILGASAADSWARGYHHWSPEVTEFEDAECGFEVNVTDFDTGFFACVDAEGWKSLQIYRMGDNYWDKQLLFLTWAAGNLRRLGITELCFESSEPEGQFQEILDLFPEGECKFKGKTVDGEYLKSKDDLTHNFACPPEEIEFTSNGDGIDVEEDECVPAGQDLIISWSGVPEDEDPEKLLSVFFEEPEDGEDPEVGYTCGEGDIEIDGYEVFVETGELESGEDFEPSQELSFDPFDDEEEEPEVTVPGAFLQPETPYKFELLVIEDSGNKTIVEVEFETCE